MNYCGVKRKIMNKHENPLVSISTITFNHAPYIRQCLDGFLMQKTDFEFEVLIHDDASTDGTEEIIREYEAKYPDIIKPLYEKENQWVKGRRGSAVFNFPRAKGKYIAMCEGDDYWTDPLKLQKQVDILESNPEYSACAHKFRGLNDGVLGNTSSIDVKNILTLYDLVWNVPFQTATVMFRKKSLIIPPKYSPYILDTFMFMLLAEQGDIYFINEYMSVYRQHEGGVWSGITIMKRIETREFYQNKRIEYFNDRNPRVAKGLKFKLSQDYIWNMFLCIQQLEVINAIKCFNRSFKYSYGKAQIKKIGSIISLVWNKKVLQKDE